MISGSARDIKSEVQKCLACCSFFRSFVRLSNVVFLFVRLFAASLFTHANSKAKARARST